MLAIMFIGFVIYMRKTRREVQDVPPPEFKQPEPYSSSRARVIEWQMRSQYSLPYTPSTFDDTDATAPNSSGPHLVVPGSSDSLSGVTPETAATTTQLVSDIPTLHSGTPSHLRGLLSTENGMTVETEPQLSEIGSAGGLTRRLTMQDAPP